MSIRKTGRKYKGHSINNGQMILMTCQPVNGYFILRGSKIAYMNEYMTFVQFNFCICYMKSNNRNWQMDPFDPSKHYYRSEWTKEEPHHHVQFSIIPRTFDKENLGKAESFLSEFFYKYN